MVKQFSVGQKVELIGCYLSQNNTCLACTRHDCLMPKEKKIGTIVRPERRGYIVKFPYQLFHHRMTEFFCGEDLLIAADNKMRNHVKALNV